MAPIYVALAECQRRVAWSALGCRAFVQLLLRFKARVTCE